MEVPFALSTSDVGRATTAVPPVFELAKEGKLNSVALVLVISVKLTEGSSSLKAATTVERFGLVVVREIATTSSEKLPLVSLVLAK